MFVFENKEYPGKIRKVSFHYWEAGPVDIVFVDDAYWISHNIIENEILTLYSDDNDDLDLKAKDFLSDTIKMCEACFLEYLNKYEPEVS